MRFHLSPEQTSIQDALRRSLSDTLSSKELHEIVDGDCSIDRASWDVLMELGVGGLLLPESVGGSGLGLLEAALACEVIGNTAAPGPIIPHLLTAIADRKSVV